ncbi:hypothetical protein KRX57_04110 [Weeksellaceae bacterium TAE3-ERU29]|nr:hypothetical protein [Weeksellaceae bacterium TAE3-ERU29]
MRKNVVFGLCLLIFGLLSTEAHARKRISIGTSEKLETVAQLPNTEEYLLDNGDYLNLGVLYERFEIAGMPLWVTEEPKIVGVNTFKRDIYYDLDDETIQAIIEENNLPSVDELKHIGFLDRYSGAIILLVVIGLSTIYVLFFKKNTPNEIEEIEDTKEENQTNINQ